MLCRYHIGGHYNWTVVSLGDGADRVFKTATAKTDPVCTKLYTSCYCRPACSSSFYFVLAVDLRKKEKNKNKNKKRSFTSTKRMTPIQSTVDVLRINLNDLLVSIL